MSAPSVVFSVLFALAVADEAGFGGASETLAPLVEDDGPVVAPTTPAPAPAATASPGGPAPTEPAPSTASLPTWTPPEGASAVAPGRTTLEVELARAGIDPARYPLVQLRVDEARLAAALAQAEARGLASAREVEARWLATRALLVDVERIALFRMHRCAARAGQATKIQSYRMTAGGPITLTTSELIAQASAVDPAGCARIELVDEDTVERARRARSLKTTLPTVAFAFHELDKRRALEDELKALLRALRAEGVERIVVPGDPGYDDR